MGKQHIIEINGKHYDAITGKLLTLQQTHPKTQNLPAKTPHIKNMDGVGRRMAANASVPKPIQRHIDKSHTLMRKTVSKPVPKKLHAVATIIDQKPAPRPTNRPNRLHAKPIPKSKLIQKFHSVNTEKPSHTQHPEIAAPRSVKPNPLSPTVVNTQSVVVNPLDQAIANATSHQQPKLKRSKLHARVAHKLHVSPKIISASAATFAILLLVAFFGYQNLPNLKMQLASKRAGVHGSLPSYQPAGFRLANISYKTGQINVSFQSNSDSRNFILTQTVSSWNSETLRDKLRTTAGISSPVEVPDKGKTLFIYNDSNITWVDGGVLYKVEGDSKLNSQQLLNLANSI